MSSSQDEGDVEEKSGDRHLFIKLLAENPVVFEKSRVPNIIRQKKKVWADLCRTYSQATGIEVIPSQMSKTLQNMKTKLKKKTDKKATGNKKIKLKDWETLLLSLLQENPAFTKVPGSCAVGVSQLTEDTSSISKNDHNESLTSLDNPSTSSQVVKQANTPCKTSYSRLASAMCGGIKAIKAAVRKQVETQLALISPQERQRQSQVVKEKLFNLEPFINSRNVSIYLSLDKEIDTEPIVRKIFDDGKTCFVPRYNKKVMEMVELHSMEDWAKLPLTKWNIKQPSFKDERRNALETGLDLIILPGVAFTKNGGRLGHGGGYYDRFLETICQKQETPPALIGIGFKEQVLEYLPVEETDYKLDMVLYGLDLIILPGVAFTKNGGRLGHGGGYYDRFLETICQKQETPPALIGIGFKEQVLEYLPVEETDYKLDMVLYGD